MVGQVKGAKLVTRTNKQTKVENTTCEVIVQFEDYDKNGDLVLSVENVNFPQDKLNDFKENINNFVSIAHLFISNQNGGWIFPDDNMNYQFFKTHPFIDTDGKVVKTPSSK
jgi:hypothetical protein